MKNMLQKGQLLSQAALTANVTTNAVDCRYLDNVAFQFNVTSGTSPSGTISIQVSVDHEEQGQIAASQSIILGSPRIVVAGNWITLTLSSTPTISAAPSYFYIELNQIAAPWVRLVYNFTSGTGFADCFACGKSLS